VCADDVEQQEGSRLGENGVRHTSGISNCDAGVAAVSSQRSADERCWKL